MRVERASSGSRRRVSLERSNVAASWGSGISSPNAANAANSARRPSRVACAISASMWSEKNWNGAVSPYSSPMNSIGVNGESSVQNAASGRALGRHPVAEGAVAHLVVVLGEDDEPLGRDVVGGGAEAPPAKARVVAVVDERAVQRLGELATSPKSA